MSRDIDKLACIAEITRGRIDRLAIFRDFFEVFAIIISNSFDPVHFDARRERAEEICDQYTRAEQAQFGKYFDELTCLYGQNLKRGNLPDLLGRIYERYGHLSPDQELTPNEIAEIMQRIALQPERQIAKRGFVELYEPTSGSGGLIFQAAEIMLAKGYNIVDKLVVFANDVNSRSVHMAYIQASLYSIPAVITQADLFSLQETDRWYTPAFILGDWVWRRPFNHTTARNRDDELLKMVTHPMYAAIRHMEGWCQEEKINEKMENPYNI